LIESIIAFFVREVVVGGNPRVTFAVPRQHVLDELGSRDAFSSLAIVKLMLMDSIIYTRNFVPPFCECTGWTIAELNLGGPIFVLRVPVKVARKVLVEPRWKTSHEKRCRRISCPIRKGSNALSTNREVAQRSLKVLLVSWCPILIPIEIIVVWVSLS
jgi:hypothetical protein